MTPLLLVITSDRVISEPFRHELSAAGFKAYYVETLASALGVVAQWQFDAILLQGQGFDDALPAMLGSLRDDAGVPILLILDTGEEERQLQALESGASQVLVEPTSMRIVAAQLRRLIDVSHQRLRHEAAEVRFGPLRLDPRRAAASIGHAQVALTSGEFELLLLLASRPGDLVHRETIARTLGRTPNADTRRSADMHVCRIRRKLRDVAGHSLVVETVYGRGYLLRMGAPARLAEEQQATEWSV
ncbi:MAG: response regulator transcription factor, partial [Caldimonas sp.]